jgi:hypothetical protein
LVIVIGWGLWTLIHSQKTSTKKAISDKLQSGTENQEISDGRYIITPDSMVNWKGKKTLIVGYEDDGTVPVKDGSFQVTNRKIVSGRIILDMTKIKADKTGLGQGESGLEHHLQSADFFSVEQYPEAVFDIDSSSYIGEGAYLVSGNLTLKEITEPVEFEVRYDKTDNQDTISAEFFIDRTVWGIQYASGKFFLNLADKVIDDNIYLSFVVPVIWDNK